MSAVDTLAGFHIDRPNRLVSDKDETYHLNWARYCCAQYYRWELAMFRQECNWNELFYRGNDHNKWQWLYSEDLSTFLNNETGDARYRLMLSDNIIMPIGRMIIGNAIRTNMSFDVKPTTDYVKRKKDYHKNVVMATDSLLRIAKGDALAYAQQHLPIGETPADTEQQFNTYYTDDFVNGVNAIVDFVSEGNDVNGALLNWIAEKLFVCGLAAVFDDDDNGWQTFRQVEAYNFFWDVSARRADMQDGTFMGDAFFDDPVNIFERYPDLSPTQKQAIEEMSKYEYRGPLWLNGTYIGSMTGKCRVMRSYWRDTDPETWACVIDEFGEEALVRVDIENSPYTEKDYVVSPKNEKFKALLDGKPTVIRRNPSIRYCHYVDTTYDGSSPNGQPIVLEYGLMRFPESDPFAIGKKKLPYKVNTFKYWAGYVQAPVSMMLSPQRFVNRLMAIMDEQSNRSMPPKFIYDKAIVDPQMGTAEFERRIRNGDPVGAMGMGQLNNMINQQPGTDLSGIQYLTTVRANIVQNAQASVGANQSMLGTGAMELVRNTQAMIAQGSLIQEDIFYSMADIVRQITQSISSLRGRSILAENPHNLAVAVGNDDAVRLIVDPEHFTENFRVRVSRSESPDAKLQSGNALAMQLLQAGLLDEGTFATLINRSSPDLVWSATSRYLEKKMIADAKMAEQAQQMQAQQMQMAQQNQQAGVDMQRESTQQASADRQQAVQAKLMEQSMKSATEIQKQKMQNYQKRQAQQQ